MKYGNLVSRHFIEAWKYRTVSCWDGLQFDQSPLTGYIHRSLREKITSNGMTFFLWQKLKWHDLHLFTLSTRKPTQMDFHCGVSRSTKALFAQMHSSLAVPCPLQVDSHTCSFHPSFPPLLFGHRAPQEPFFNELDLIYSWRNLDVPSELLLLPRFADLLFSGWQWGGSVDKELPFLMFLHFR